MKKVKSLPIVFLICMLCGALLFSGCSTDGTADVSDGTDTTAPIEAPSEDLAAHEITVSEITSLLKANGLITNTKRWSAEGAAYHGGQQMRVCHTERGTYTAFAKDIGETADFLSYYVAKVDNDSRVTLLYYGQLWGGGDGTVSVNIGQDITGDIIVTATSGSEHSVHIFDRETDAVSSYQTEPSFSTDDSSWKSRPGYSQTLYDFENRKLYAFSVRGSGIEVDTVSDALIEWYSFDIDRREWSEESVHVWIEGIGRHGYLYPFADGKGGAYIIATRNEYAEITAGRFSMAEAERTYVWDRLTLFYIPDLTTGENTEYTIVQEEDDSLGLEGIWSVNQCNGNGDVFVDSNGYMHITYFYYLHDYTGQHAEYDNDQQYCHIIYKGLERIHSEKITVRDESNMLYRPMVRQSTDGRLHMIIADMSRTGNAIELDFYQAEDELGRSWSFRKTVVLDEGITTNSLSLSGVRDGSVQDDTVSAFFYGYNTELDKTVYTFDISLEDYSVTRLVNILEDYDIQLDWWSDKRMPYADHQTAVVKTENGSYAAFVYNYDYNERFEQFCIVKTDADGKSTVLFSDMFESEQNKYLTMSCDESGMIYVCPPTGRHIYTVDPATDEVTAKETTPIVTNKLLPRQTDIISDPVTGELYTVSVLVDGEMSVSSNVVDREKISVALKNAVTHSNDRELIGKYDNIHTLSDGKGGVYLIGTRTVDQDVLDGKLEYNGYISSFSDSVMLFYLPGLTKDNTVQCIDVQSPYEDEGAEGIWSVVRIKDVYLARDGKLNVIYSSYSFDFDDGDRNKNPELIEKTLKYYIAVYDGGELVSKDELKINGINKDTSVRMTETADGTVYLLTANLHKDFECLGYDKLNFGRYPEGGDAKISVYFKAAEGWTVAAEKILGQFAAEGFYISDITDDTVGCIVYTSDRDVYYTGIKFDPRD
ncbi:MAG: hypothetical protein IKV54_07770 [Clostridia bacterium]|nr:hypothetical protein [Clostridia bacterium]